MLNVIEFTHKEPADSYAANRRKRKQHQKDREDFVLFIQTLIFLTCMAASCLLVRIIALWMQEVL